MFIICSKHTNCKRMVISLPVVAGSCVEFAISVTPDDVASSERFAVVVPAPALLESRWLLVDEVVTETATGVVKAFADDVVGVACDVGDENETGWNVVAFVVVEIALEVYDDLVAVSKGPVTLFAVPAVVVSVGSDDVPFVVLAAVVNVVVVSVWLS